MSKHTFVVLAYKESKYLENCIKSVLNQKYKSDVVIATSTKNDYITKIAEKYNLQIIENKNPNKGIGADFEFARTCVKSDVITIAHQDDYYEPEYSLNVMQQYDKHPDATILFSDYYEIKNGKKFETNTNLKIKRILLLPLRAKFLSGFKCIKRLSLRFGNAICCPAVSFVNKNINVENVFECDFKCNVDWYAWEQLSNNKGKFIFIPKLLMGHLVYEGSTTTAIINDNVRTKEDLVMFKKFWPNFIANFINKFYKKSEEGNFKE